MISPNGKHEARIANPGYCGVLCDFYPNVVIKERGKWLNHSKTVASFYEIHPESLKVEWKNSNKLIVYSTGNKSPCINFDKYNKEVQWKSIGIEYVTCTNNLKSQRMLLEVLRQGSD